MANVSLARDMSDLASEAFALNPDPVVHERRIGRKQRVVIVDGFYRYPDRVAALVPRTIGVT